MPYPSKVSLPVRRPAIVRRERLVEALAHALEYRIVLVSAPAGYGKTTLLYDFAQSCQMPVCWYAMDERDVDQPTFLRYFVAAGQKQFPDFGSDLANALASGEPISQDCATDLMVKATLSAGQPFVMVLDDFHFLDNAPDSLRQAIEGWLYRLPHDCHVIVSGRTQPQIGILPLMSVRQEVKTVTARDFSFLPDEVVQLFRDVLGREISLDDAQHLADVTEGWAASLVLLADRVQEARSAHSLENLRGSDTLYQYINLEQFAPLPPKVKEFLLASALPRTIDDDLVRELTGNPDTEETLSFLERQNLFVLRDEQDRSHRRYHRLFRAFLVSHFRLAHPERFKELNLRAAHYRENAEQWEDAVYHYMQAGAWEQIVHVTERVGWQMFEEGRWDTLADWLDAVPTEALGAQPRLILWKARILHYLNQVDRALSLLAQAISSADERGDTLARAEALVTKGMCLRVKGDYQESREALTTARDLIKDSHPGSPALTEARKELGITYSLCGDLQQAISELTGVLAEYEATGDSYNIAHTSDQLAVTLGLAGRLAESASHLERARQRWNRLGNNHRLIQTLINLAVVYFLQGDYDNAESAIAQGLQLSAAIDSSQREVYLRATLADIKRDRGQYQEALELYNACLEQSWTLDDAYVRVYTTDCIANTYRLMGEISLAESWASRAMSEAEARGGALESGICLTTAALVKRAQGELKEAVGYLEKAIAYLREANAGRELATAHFHLAATLFTLKRKSNALKELEEAAAVVATLGYDHFLAVEAARNPLLIQYGAANKAANGYYARLLKLISRPVAAADANEGGEDAPAQDDDPNAIHAYGFGNLRAVRGGAEVTDLEWRAEKAKEMFFFFLCHRRPLRKEEIVAALWPDLPEEKATSAFHSNMYRLRQALYKDVIAKDSGHYILDPQGKFSFDVDDFQAALREAASLPKGDPASMEQLEKAVALYKGQFAPGFFSEWAETLRWSLEEQYMSTLATLSALYADAGEYKKSAEICQKIVEIDEYNEAAWYRLMSIYIRWDQIEAARYCHGRYTAVLKRDDPDEEPPTFEDTLSELAVSR